MTPSITSSPALAEGLTAPSLEALGLRFGHAFADPGLLELALRHQERGNEAQVLRLLGEIALHQEPRDVGAAEAHYARALALAHEREMRPLAAHCHLGLGTLYAQTGCAAQAHAALSAAIDLYRAMDMTLWLPQAEAALTQVEGQ